MYIDGEKFGAFDFINGVSAIDKVFFDTGGASNTRYIDAIGYSWDPNYEIGDNRFDLTEAGCYLEYFELSFSQYLDPNDSDFDEDGIMDGVEMGLLVEGTSTIDYKDTYGFPYSLENETAWWTFDEGEGTEVLDLTENGHDGTINGASWVDGLAGSHALQFDGINDWVDIGTDPIGANEDVSFMAWVYPTGSSADYIISSGAQTSSVGNYLLWRDNQFALGRKTPYKIADSGYFGNYPINQWYYVAGVYNVTEGELRVYINGDLISTHSQTSASFIITALGGVTAIPVGYWETVAALAIFGILITIGFTFLINSLISNDPITPYYALGWFLGLLISAIMFATFCKLEPSFEITKKVIVTAMKLLVILIGSMAKLIFGSIASLFEFDTLELLVMEWIGTAIQFTLLIFACLLSAATLFGNFNEGAEDVTKMVAICSIMSFIAFSFLFLISAFGGA
ncbi:MAG: LamG-like jellyroll fold domain-containing protein [Promethearchaeota archaeon]